MAAPKRLSPITFFKGNKTQEPVRVRVEPEMAPSKPRRGRPPKVKSEPEEQSPSSDAEL